MLHLHTLGVLRLVGPHGEIIAGRRKELVLLAYLARVRPRAVARAELAALLWSERPEANARQSLRQSLLHLKRALPEHLDVQNETVALSGALEWDVAEFERDLARGELRRAAELWGGDFLPTTEDVGGEGYRVWLETEREALRRRLAWGLERLLQEAARRGHWAEAVVWAERWTTTFPSEEEPHRWLVDALRHAGRPADALARHAGFVARLQREYELEPSTALIALGADLELAGRSGVAERGAAATMPLAPTGYRRRFGRRWWLAAALALLAVGVWLGARRSRSGHAILAVGSFRNLSGPDTAEYARIMPELLATNLARLPGIHVVSTARMIEVEAQLRRAGGPSEPARVARQAGATELLEGALAQHADGRYRLDLRIADLGSGAVLGAFAVEGTDAFALVDSITSRIASSLRVASHSLRVADVTTASLSAYRLYQQGLRAYFDNDRGSAQLLLRAALAEDSSFAMAAYYLALLTSSDADWGRAVALATHATDRERLLILGGHASTQEDPTRLAIAETLATRYPLDPDGHQLLGQMLLWSGDFVGAVPHLRRAVAMDSLSLNGEGPCRACAAYWTLIDAYTFADSLIAAEQVARTWTRRQSQSRAAWDKLAGTLELEGRYEEALSALKTGEARGMQGVPGRLYELLLHLGEFDQVEQIFEQQLRQAPPAVRVDWLWSRTISLRYVGRLRTALAVALELRRLGRELDPKAVSPPGAITHALVLQDMGRYREAVALWDSITVAGVRASSSPGWRARTAVWGLTHEADALAAAGDTDQLRSLADSVERLGQLSAFGRDRRLHHHLRGLLLRLEGRPLEAAAEFRAALFGPYLFTRTNLELGRSLLAGGRPGEAIPILQAGLHSPVEIWGMYATGTELHELLGQAFEAVGEADSAAQHDRWVLAAWSHADPEFSPRREAIRARLAALEAGRNARRGNDFGRRSEHLSS